MRLLQVLFGHVTQGLRDFQWVLGHHFLRGTGVESTRGALLHPACIIVFCWGVAVSLMVSVVELIHGSGTHFRIVTAIKCKEKPILHQEIDEGFGLRSLLSRRLIGSLLGALWRDCRSKSGAVSECRMSSSVILLPFDGPGFPFAPKRLVCA